MLRVGSGGAFELWMLEFESFLASNSLLKSLLVSVRMFGFWWIEESFFAKLDICDNVDIIELVSSNDKSSLSFGFLGVSFSFVP